jgi:guanylate kinase
MEKGGLFIVSAPSGTGKTTLCKKLMASVPGISFSVSHTTRAPRSGEVNGKDYFFVQEDTFKKMLSRGKFLESNEVHDNFYGTSRNEVVSRLDNGEDVILDIDVQGGTEIKKLFPEAFMLYILPPSWEALEKRLLERGSEGPESLKVRLQNARKELKQLHEYEFIIINDDLETALEEFKAIIIAMRCKRSRVIQGEKAQKILKHIT